MPACHFISNSKPALLRYINLCKLNNAGGKFIPNGYIIFLTAVIAFNFLIFNLVVIDQFLNGIILILIGSPFVRIDVKEIDPRKCFLCELGSFRDNILIKEILDPLRGFTIDNGKKLVNKNIMKVSCGPVKLLLVAFNQCLV